jgi:Ca2+-binding EF-hand superfamily protein
MAPVSWIRCLFGALVFLFPALPAAAQGTPGGNDDEPTALERMLFPNVAREQFIATVLAPLRALDTDQNGLDAAEIDAIEAQRLASLRASQMQTLLRYDLDWDGRVTREEVRRVTGAARAGHGRIMNDEILKKLIDKAVDRVMQADADGDGVVTLEEMRAQQATKENPQRSHNDTARARMLLALDPDKDGHLTAEELTKLARDTFARYDKDGNGVLSADEVAPLRECSNRSAMMSRLLARCTLPMPAADAHVAALGIYEGESVPTVSVAGLDATTSTARVIIEPGDKPIYLLLTAYDHMIWQIGGDTKRVSRAVVVARTSRGKPGAGVTGLPAERVTFVDGSACRLAFHDTNSAKTVQVRAAIEHALKHPVESVAGTYRLLAINIPSGTPAEAPKLDRASPAGVPQRVWSNFVRFTPGGLNVIDAKTVVSPQPAEAYDVLPGHAGIVQLVQDGAIEPMNDGTLHIVKPIPHFPAGLFGSLSVTYLLGKGLPMPAGSPGHSCVISEETGMPLTSTPHCVLR